MTYKPIPTEVEGGQKKVPVVEDEGIGLLGQILTQLKIMNLHFSTMTDQEFKPTEVDS